MSPTWRWSVQWWAGGRRKGSDRRRRKSAALQTRTQILSLGESVWWRGELDQMKWINEPNRTVMNLFGRSPDRERGPRCPRGPASSPAAPGTKSPEPAEPTRPAGRWNPAESGSSSYIAHVCSPSWSVCTIKQSLLHSESISLHENNHYLMFICLSFVKSVPVITELVCDGLAYQLTVPLQRVERILNRLVDGFLDRATNVLDLVHTTAGLQTKTQKQQNK